MRELYEEHANALQEMIPGKESCYQAFSRRKNMPLHNKTIYKSQYQLSHGQKEIHIQKFQKRYIVLPLVEFQAQICISLFLMNMTIVKPPIFLFFF